MVNDMVIYSQEVKITQNEGRKKDTKLVQQITFDEILKEEDKAALQPIQYSFLEL